jgi:uncharacterized protein (TIGR02246 family)
MRRLLHIVMACSFALAPVSAHARKSGSTNAADQIAALKVQLATALHSKHLEDIPPLFAPDGSFLSRTTGRVTGRDAIRGLFESVMNSYSSDITLTSLHIERSQDLAFDSGDFDETVTAISDGKKYEVRGSYLIVFKHQRDGGWLILEQVMIDKTHVNH